MMSSYKILNLNNYKVKKATWLILSFGFLSFGRISLFLSPNYAMPIKRIANIMKVYIKRNN